jgi:peptide/nickel transport system permease protein
MALVFLLIAACVPELYTRDPYLSDPARILEPPSRDHWFGTDRQGRDLFARTVYGARRSLVFALTAEFLVILLGTLAGSISGYWRRSAIALIADAVGAIALSLPFLLLGMVAAAVFSAFGLPLIAAVAAVGWVYTMRIVRGEVAKLRNSTSVVAALAWGFSRRRVLGRVVLPQLLHILPSIALFGVAEIIAIEAGLSFFGIGVIGATPSLGGILLDARTLAADFWWLAVFPSLALLTLILSCNFFADLMRTHAQARPCS